MPISDTQLAQVRAALPRLSTLATQPTANRAGKAIVKAQILPALFDHAKLFESVCGQMLTEEIEAGVEALAPMITSPAKRRTTVLRCFDRPAVLQYRSTEFRPLTEERAAISLRIMLQTFREADGEPLQMLTEEGAEN